MRLDTSLESLIGVGRSESVTDLNNELLSSSRTSTMRTRHSFAADGEMPSKPFGLGMNLPYVYKFFFSYLTLIFLWYKYFIQSIKKTHTYASNKMMKDLLNNGP